MRKHKSAWPFLEPVNKEDVPDYYDIVTDPIGKHHNHIIDIKSIEKKLISNQYQSKDAFVRDVRRVFSNARYFHCFK